jgi:large subunit ribosomal protein L25
MPKQVELQVARRETLGKAAKRLRKAGIIPANIFGHHQDSMAIQLDALAFERLRRSHGTRGIIALKIPGQRKAETALIRHMERDPISGQILHIDFFRVSMSERITVKVPLHLVGEAPGVKIEDGVLLHLLDALEIECRASDIPDSLTVDISPLAAIDDILYAKDIQLPANVTLITDPDEPVVKIAATRAEVAEEAEEEQAAAAATAETPAAPAPAENEG